jgi:hypothetical protein
MNNSKTIFDIMDEKDWKIYYHDISLSLLTSKTLFKKYFLKKKFENFDKFNQFYKGLMFF